MCIGSASERGRLMFSLIPHIIQTSSVVVLFPCLYLERHVYAVTLTPALNTAELPPSSISSSSSSVVAFPAVTNRKNSYILYIYTHQITNEIKNSNTTLFIVNHLFVGLLFVGCFVLAMAPSQALKLRKKDT